MPTRFTTDAPRLTVGEIVTTALALLQDRSLEELTLRGLASELDVTPMALYHHVGNKDDLLLLIADELLASRPLRRSRDWRRVLAMHARSMRSLLSEYPTISELITRRAFDTPAAQQRLSMALSALMAAGFTEDGGTAAYAAVHTYTVGFCALESGRRTAGAHRVGAVEPMAARIHAFVSDDQFEVGLQALLRGLSPT